MVCLWCGLTDGRRSRDYKSLPKFLRSIDNQIFLRMVRETALLILVINKKRIYLITISYPTTFNKSPTRMPPGSNIHKHFLHLFLLLPTTLYKKKNGVKVLLKECLFSYHSRSRTPQAWSRGDEVSVFSSTQVLKEDPFCLNPVHSLYTEKVN